MAVINVTKVEAKLLMDGLEKMKFKYKNDPDRFKIIQRLQKEIEITDEDTDNPDGINESDGPVF